MAKNSNFKRPRQLILRHVGKPLVQETYRFLSVGGVGFIINFTVLTILHGWLKMWLVPSQLIAAELAILSNYNLHNRWTYKNRSTDPGWLKLLKFHGTAWTGGLVISLTLFAAVRWLHVHYLVGLVAGSAAGLVWNFLWNRYFVWRRTHSHKAA
ncbi:GtrA family protein [Candidatus Microgenomates bacterium]|nr:GtrA family protein [Candidatus Microgenomates bacterium]